jgi:hypothetical protein
VAGRESDPRWWDEDLARARRNHGRGHRLEAAWGYARAGVRYGSAADLLEGARVLLGGSPADGGPPGASEAVPPHAPEWLERGFHRRLSLRPEQLQVRPRHQRISSSNVVSGFQPRSRSALA